MLWVLICSVHLTVCSYHIAYAFQSDSTLYVCLNVKELLARNRRKIWSLSDCNCNRTHNHLVCKWKLNHLAKLAKWLGCVVRTYLYGVFDCMLSSCHVRVSEWIQTLWLSECQGTPCSRQAQNQMFKQLDVQAATECGFTLKPARDMTRTYNQMYRTDKYSQHSSINWPI